MRILRRVSVTAKVNLLICLVAFTAAFLACLGFAGLELHQTRTAELQKLRGQATLLGHYGSDAISQQDRELGWQLLAPLEQDDSIEVACLYDTQQRCISHCGAATSLPFPIQLRHRTDGLVSQGRAEILSPVSVAGQPCGFIYLRSSIRSAQAQLGRFIGGAGLIGLIVAGLCSAATHLTIRAMTARLDSNLSGAREDRLPGLNGLQKSLGAKPLAIEPRAGNSEACSTLPTVTNAIGAPPSGGTDSTADDAAPRATTGRILVADSSDTGRDHTQLVLRRAGFRVVGVRNGREAVEATLRHPFDLILMDMQMPTMDGYSAAREIRSSGSDVPIIALTRGEIDEDACRDAGCIGHLAQPVDAAALLDVMQSVVPIRRSAPQMIESAQNFKPRAPHLLMRTRRRHSFETR